MEFEDILQAVLALARKQFPDHRGEIGPETSASDVAAWNSLSHVMLIASVEKEFGIRFDLPQMVGMTTLGDIAEATQEMAG